MCGQKLSSYILLLLPALFSCAAARSSYKTTTFYLNTDSYSVIDETDKADIINLDYIVISVAKIFNKENDLLGLTITITNEPIFCGPYINANGCYKCNANNITVLFSKQTEKCIADSSLTHELMHYFLEKTTGTCDPQHRFDAIWAVDGLLYHLMSYYIGKLCTNKG